MSEEKNGQQSSSKDTINKRFERERNEYTDKIKELTGRMRDIKDLANVMVDTLSLRQVALDYSFTLRDMILKLNADYKKKRKERRHWYTSECDERLTEKVIEMNIDVDLEKDLKILETFNHHLSFMTGTIETLDKMNYAVKYRIELEQYNVAQR